MSRKFIALNDGQLQPVDFVKKFVKNLGIGNSLGRICFDDGGTVKNKILGLNRKVGIGLGNYRKTGWNLVGNFRTRTTGSW